MVGIWSVPVLALIVQLIEFRGVAWERGIGPEHLPRAKQLVIQYRTTGRCDGSHFPDPCDAFRRLRSRLAFGGSVQAWDPPEASGPTVPGACAFAGACR